MLNVQLLRIEHIRKFPQISLRTFMHSFMLPRPPQDQYTTPQLSCIISPSSPTAPLSRNITAALLRSPQGTTASRAL
jgi:hypothetical protein